MALSALSAVLQQFLRTEYPLGPSASDLVTEAKTTLALKASCKRLSEHDASQWLWGGPGGEGIRFCIAEAREEARFNDPEAMPEEPAYPDSPDF